MDCKKEVSWWEKLEGFGGNILSDKFGWDIGEDEVVLNNIEYFKFCNGML